MRFELRSPDPSANPYIAYALLIYAGLEGIRTESSLCPPVNVNLFTAGPEVTDSLETLPASLPEALELARPQPPWLPGICRKFCKTRGLPPNPHRQEGADVTNQKNTQSVLVVASGQKSGGFLQEMLPPSKFSPVLTARDVGSAQRMLIERDVDLVLINTPLPDDFGVQLAVEASEKYNCGVLVFVKAELLEAVEQKVEEYGILTLPRPTSRQIVYQTLHLLAASRRKIRALEEKTSSLQNKMEEIRLVNRAKLLLVECLKMSESEAHRYIEKTAMDRCVRRREIAENIIRTYGS